MDSLTALRCKFNRLLPHASQSPAIPAELPHAHLRCKAIPPTGVKLCFAADPN
jgi:hypothetical protein